uniref:HNH nuclease domain-containing protein n=1 Tax=Leersia perrieri TaxID=77586 RepID=A0A0D9VQ07_9ORYZ
MENVKGGAAAGGNGWMTVPAFGDWDMKNGALPDYSMDFSKIREMRKQNKKELSRTSLGGDEDLIAQQKQQQQQKQKPAQASLGRPANDHHRQIHGRDGSPTETDAPAPASSFGATPRPASPRSASASASAVAEELDGLLLTAPPPSSSEPRSFSYVVKQQCWEKAERVAGRDPERWRRDALGNVVFRKLVGCPGCLCHDYDHIVPYSKGGKSTLENCQVLQATVNRSKGNKTEISKSELIQKSAYCRVSGRDMDLLELSAYGNVRRGPDSGGCRIQ